MDATGKDFSLQMHLRSEKIQFPVVIIKYNFHGGNAYEIHKHR